MKETKSFLMTKIIAILMIVAFTFVAATVYPTRVEAAKTVKASSITLNKTKATVAIGKKLQLKATVKPTNTTNKSVKWSLSSAGKKIASISSKGLVTIKNAKANIGKTFTVAAKTTNGKKATSKITVGAVNPVESVTMNKSTAKVDIGETVQLSAKVLPTNADVKTLKWTLSGAGKEMASIDQKGLVTIKNVVANVGKTFTVAATATNGKKATSKITVQTTYASYDASKILGETFRASTGASKADVIATLPKTVPVKDIYGNTANASITWTLPDYNADVEDSYNLIGTVTLSSNWKNVTENAFVMTDKLVVATPANRLTAAKAAADAKVSDEEKYTEASFKVLTDALKDFVAINTSGTDAEKTAKAIAIENAIKGLVKTPEQLLKEAKAAAVLTESDYTVASWKVLTDALALPETDDSERVAKTTAIEKAIKGLVTKKEVELAAIKVEVAKLKASDYTAAKWEGLTNALALPETDDTERGTKITGIKSAVDGLVKNPIAPTVLLDNAKVAANKLKEADYKTPAKWKALTDALAMSEQNDIERNAKAIAINNAISGLASDKTGAAELTDARVAVEALVKSDYELGAWEIFEDALEAAEKTEEGTDAEKSIKATLILSKITTLKSSKTPTAELRDAKAAATALKLSDCVYSGATGTLTEWMTLVSELALAENSEALKIAKAAAINAAISALKS